MGFFEALWGSWGVSRWLLRSRLRSPVACARSRWAEDLLPELIYMSRPDGSVPTGRIVKQRRQMTNGRKTNTEWSPEHFLPPSDPSCVPWTISKSSAVFARVDRVLRAEGGGWWPLVVTALHLTVARKKDDWTRERNWFLSGRVLKLRFWLMPLTSLDSVVALFRRFHLWRIWPASRKMPWPTVSIWRPWDIWRSVGPHKIQCWDIHWETT